MVFRGFLQKFKQEEVIDSEEDYIEIDTAEEMNSGRLLIKIETLTDFSDTDRIQEQLRSGHIVWVKIKPLKDKDMVELKRSVDRLRKTCIAVNGDIAGIDEDFLILTPEGVNVHRG
jgi:SepF-like predicted cell division protein (DUF552 family)